MDTLGRVEYSARSRVARGRSQSRKPQRWHSPRKKRLQTDRLRWAMSTSWQSPSLLLQVICSRCETRREARRKQEGIGRCDEGARVGTGGANGYIRSLTQAAGASQEEKTNVA